MLNSLWLRNHHTIYIYILYSMVSAQQTNLLPENASQNDTIFPGAINDTVEAHSCVDNSEIH